MSIPEYFQRSALAVAQVVAGFDEAAIRDRLDSVVLGIYVSQAAARSAQGRAAAELVVRLAARLYPAIRLEGPSGLVQEMAALALAINPVITLSTSDPATVHLYLGATRDRQPDPTSLYVGSTAETALLSAERPVRFGQSETPFGASAAACLAMARVFRSVFLGAPLAQGAESFPVIPPELGKRRRSLQGPLALIGLGAIGNAAAWTLSRVTPGDGVDLVDPEQLELSNLQRYVLCARDDVGTPKVDIGQRFLPAARAFPVDLADFLRQTGYDHDLLLVSVDSARARVAAQASLPRVVVNGWTQPGDLGVSTHRLDGPGACLACLYLPQTATANEDAVYAQALGIPELQPQVRTLLFNGLAVPDEILELIGQRLHIEAESARAFSGRGVRELYREGICGGELLPIGSVGSPREEVHVPLAHQSALAGVIQAARAFAGDHALAGKPTIITRLNVLRAIDPAYVNQPALKRDDGMCICQDKDYLGAYAAKYGRDTGVPHAYEVATDG